MRDLLILASLLVAGRALAQSPPLTLGTYKVKAVEQARRIAVFDTPKNDTVAVDDSVLIITKDGEFSLGCVFLHDENHFAVKVATEAAAPSSGDTAIRVPRDAGAIMRSWLPPGTTLAARIDARSPSGATAWLDCGERDGFRANDSLRVLRNDIPIARATIADLRDHLALVSLSPLVSNAPVAIGDTAILWPGPADQAAGILENKVLYVKPVAGTDRTEVWIPTDANDSPAVGSHWEIRRGGEYVDCVEIGERRGRFAIALQSPAFAREPIQVGDSATLRTPAQVALGAIPLRIFRREGDYFLMNGGEDAGLEIGGRLVVIRENRVLAELAIDTVKVDYCGASRVAPAGAGPMATTRPGGDRLIREWDAVVPLAASPTGPEGGSIGRVERLLADDQGRGDWIVARPSRIGAQVASGQLVKIMTQPPAVGLVVTVARGVWVIHVPPSCKRGTVSSGAAIARP